MDESLSLSAPRPARPAPGSTALRLTGRDVLTVLHRVTTNALEDLAPGAARATLFCDFRGRLLHRAVVARLADDAVWLLRDDAPGEPLAAALDRSIFREDVKIDDRSRVHPVLAVPGGFAMTLGTVRGDDVPTHVQTEPDWGLRLTSDPPQDAATLELARIRVGRAAHDHEIVSEFHPFEVNLGRDVHLSKGCFTGQEVLMRLQTYDSVRRRLGSVGGDGAPPAVPLDVLAGDKRIGRLTSAAREGARWLGLAVLQHAAFEADVALHLEDGTALAAPIPFELARPLGRP